MQGTRIPATLYLGASDVIRLVRLEGLSACLAGVAARIERDFLRWDSFDKTARVASHSRDGVIELMPIANRQRRAGRVPGAGVSRSARHRRAAACRRDR